ncbi:MAG: hypothetical protein H5T85_06530 [Actinobacteria bacterium]|nr:hypothetical protein [Actinomycetota bacterium]
MKLYKSKKIRVINIYKFLKEDESLNDIVKDTIYALLVPIDNSGIFMFICKDEKQIDDEIRRIINLFVKQSIIAFKRVCLEELLKKGAGIDQLTGIYNRRYFITI